MPYQENKDFHELLKKVDSCFNGELPFSLYRKPLENQVNCIFQSDNSLHTISDFEDKGFVFAPFDLNNNAIVVKPDEVHSVVFQKEKTRNRSENFTLSQDKDVHLKLVEKGIAAIGKGALKKVVLSRKVKVKLSKSPIEIFITLLNSYPNAFCYLFFHPKVGTWCGATPETLMRIENGILSTMSLAATLPFKEGVEPKWGTKEIEEQEMVSSYIEERLSGSMEELNLGRAESVRAGNLWHLKSEIKGKLLAKAKIGDIVGALHPTPAVCGIPMQAAKTFIMDNENYKRTYYTGFLGELNMRDNKETHLFVNLRCMELTDEKATIFVGGGITAASDPESEWTETQNKSMTMLNII
ncbi:chorismate-binding protein [Flagellimonas sp.]|uniref:chorismate-binding protein n=1 Tax=Flagellimonas sp. TaxID=2058762 RepID=UPI003B5B18E7